MNIDQAIEKWQEHHATLLNRYSKATDSKEVLQEYRSQMKAIIDFIEELKELKNKAETFENFISAVAVVKSKLFELNEQYRNDNISQDLWIRSSRNVIVLFTSKWTETEFSSRPEYEELYSEGWRLGSL